MGDCHCSNIAIMQLFHELKQQFPALPDHVVSQCIAQNSHDKETCARSLRATQESRPPSGAFPPPPPPDTLTSINAMTTNHQAAPRPHRPASLDIGVAHTCPRTPNGAPASAPAACPSRGFFDDLTNPNNAGFELNVNVACSPAAGNRDFRTIPVGGTCKRSALLVEPRPHYVGHVPDHNGGLTNGLTDTSRSYTSVSLTLRPPSSEPQPPINIRSHGSSLTYSTSSVDPRGFQSRLQISIGPGAIGSVAAARIRPPMGPTRPTTLLPPASTPHRPPGLPAGPPSQLPRPTTTVSAPTTPSVPTTAGLAPSTSLPTTPASPSPSTFAPNANPPPPILTNTTVADFLQSPVNKVADHQKQLVAEQMVRRNRLAKELRAEKGKLDAMKRELKCLARPFNAATPPQELESKLRSEIYQLQVECDRMASEVDQTSDPAVPLGETNEEFYQSIYTGQPFVPFAGTNPRPPPLPSRPPAWIPSGDREERDGPSWVCGMCTFDNHPLMDKCEQCDMPRLPSHSSGTASLKCLVPVESLRPLFNSGPTQKRDDQTSKTAPLTQER
ncbi:TGF-beta-activated kinase 1 and MAP3K7-binding protein 2-like isoform X2 [Diprion similis]|uniref:TGF-beta-activated kinase 1 and MAP3K7-binding protein 2-like isoform X2 n=2 Tax=Diprion similis TaxID=362088 RepID=UPI001EF7A529|nr:TGF-beta-activated kinase 1 and MAP3K7-binding protein 2-like isoform X2 [Diprion similis]